MKWMIERGIILAFALAASLSFVCGMPVRAESALAGPVTHPGLEVIESISVHGEGDASELRIKLSAPATYTSFKTTSPLRLVIDLSQVAKGPIVAPLLLSRGNFKTVNVNNFDTEAGVFTRVDIELFKDVEPVIHIAPEQPAELRISFPALATKEAVPETSSTKTAETVTLSASAVEAPPTDPVAPPKTESEPVVIATPPTVLHTLTSVSGRHGAIVMIVDGGVGEFKSFRLSKPERLVVDLFNVNNGMATRIVPVNISGVASARLGVYPDKVRVVFDAINGSFPAAEVSKTDEGINVILNGVAAVVKAAVNKAATTADMASTDKASTGKAAADKAAAKVEETPKILAKSVDKTTPESTVRSTGPARVEMIDFQVIEGVSRVAVKVLGEVAVDAPVSSPGFVTLTIKNTTLPKRLQRSLEAQSFDSPVLRITPLSVKIRKRTDTKLRIALRTATPHEFRHEGDMLFVDFKNPGGMTADKVSRDLQEPRSQGAISAKPSTGKETELGKELIAPLESPAVKPSDSAKSYKGRKVTLEFADAEVRKIFQLLSEVSNKNFVLGDDVTGTISIKLVNVPWDQALDIILDTKGLDKREEGNIIIIRGKGKFKSLADEELEIKKTLYKSIELKTETFNVNYSDLGSIVTQFSALKTERGTISPDARTNKIIVKDIPQVIEEMRKLLIQLDVPERQVMIEARIVEATSTFTRNLGVSWGVHYRDGSASFLGINQLDTGFGGLTSAPPTSGTGTSAGGNVGISFGTLTSNIQLDMRLNAAASAGLIKIVSTPKVATLNNKTAKITQGQQIPYTSSTSDKVETKFIEAALSLEVTPHINANGTIGMKIDAKNDSPGTSSGGGAPAINKKQATTEMLLRDGETTVIGGIFVDSDTESDDGVPFLMDIPLFGKLFKTNNKSKSKSELLVFITPRILGSL